MDPTSFVANGRTYVVPAAPVVVICIDGREPDYHVEALKAGRMPWPRGLDGEGSSWPAHRALPAPTNSNNLSIATGHPPAVHGISGNCIFDDTSGEEVLMNDRCFLHADGLRGRCRGRARRRRRDRQGQAAQAARRRPGRGQARVEPTGQAARAHARSQAANRDQASEEW